MTQVRPNKKLVKSATAMAFMCRRETPRRIKTQLGYMSTYEIGGREEVKDELLRTFRVNDLVVPAHVSYQGSTGH